MFELAFLFFSFLEGEMVESVARFYTIVVGSFCEVGWVIE